MTVRVVVLDSTPLSLLCGPPRRVDVVTCRQWCDALVLAGNRVYYPRGHRLRSPPRAPPAKKDASAGRLTALRGFLEYLPLNTPTMERAARVWADARQRGRPTAPDPALDVDMILVAQAESLMAPNTVIATSNVAHIVPFHPAEFWSAITP